MKINKDLVLSMIAVLIIILVGILVGYLLFKANNAYNSILGMTNEDGLIFELHYGNLNCDVVSLEVYNDNTYKYYYSDYESPRLGTYDYKISDIINASSLTGDGPYFLTTGKNTEYSTDKNNHYLREFLNSIGIDIEQCKLTNE